MRSAGQEIKHVLNGAGRIDLSGFGTLAVPCPAPAGRGEEESGFLPRTPYPSLRPIVARTAHVVGASVKPGAKP